MMGSQISLFDCPKCHLKIRDLMTFYNTFKPANFDVIEKSFISKNEIEYILRCTHCGGEFQKVIKCTK